MQSRRSNIKKLTTIMPKSYNSVWIHLIFSTKNREAVLSKEIRNSVCDFLRNESILKGYYLDSINGYENHLHLLYKQSLKESISDFVKWYKGRSSKWINDHYDFETNFRWQQGYGVFSVSKENLERTRNYIYEQERIHLNRSLQKENKLLITKTDS